MANLRLRWSAVVCAAVLAFVAYWAVLKFLLSLSGGDALGWAVVPFSIVLALGGGWADQPGGTVNTRIRVRRRSMATSRVTAWFKSSVRLRMPDNCKWGMT
jgi:hypothetical protein